MISDDFNNDNELDLVVANHGDNTVSVLLGNGKGNFHTQYKYMAGNYPSSVISGDFNNDSKLDLAVANGKSEEWSILLNSCE